MKKNEHTFTQIAVLMMAAMVSISAVHAKDMKILSAAEITSTISDSTSFGVFGENNTKYAQRNHRNGIAVVHIEGADIRLIPWFVKESGRYCEDWGKDGVLCYRIGVNSQVNKYYFVHKDGTIVESTLKKGFHSIAFEQH